MVQHIVLALVNGLHTLATVLLIGFYTLLSIVFLPAFRCCLAPTEFRVVFGAIYNRFKHWQFGSFGMVAVTGIFLTFTDPFYKGMGQFVNMWSIAMLIKHLFILVFVLLVLYTHFLSASLLAAASGSEQADKTMRRLYRTIAGSALSGVAVLLFNAAAQAF